MQYVDIHTWMRGDILLKADKMTMANSLELRVPFLDKVVFDVASKIPDELKTKNGTTKYLLRKATEGIVPEHVLNRKSLVSCTDPSLAEKRNERMGAEHYSGKPNGCLHPQGLCPSAS